MSNFYLFRCAKIKHLGRYIFSIGKRFFYLIKLEMHFTATNKCKENFISIIFSMYYKFKHRFIRKIFV
jgi:hypothetical protein